MKTLRRFSTALVLLSLIKSTALPQEARLGIVITSQPVTLAKIAARYEYQVAVFSFRATDTFKYRLSSAPTGMSIDSVKGLLQWKPAQLGTFAVEIVVTNQQGEKASQSFKLHVVRFLGTIVGTVKGDDGKTLPRIIVTLYPQAKPTSTNRDPVIPIPWYSAVTDSMGRYSIANVDSGSYFAYAMTYCSMLMSPIPCPEDDYLSVWYKDSPTINGATSIPVKDSNKVQTDFVMHKRTKPVVVSVSGRVADTLSKPIRGATVVLSGYRKGPSILNGDIGMPGDYSIVNLSGGTFGLFPDVVGFGKTDSLGNYRVSVLSAGPFIAAVFAEGYLLQYYKLKGNVLEANQMTLTKDSAGVNFRLLAVPKVNAIVSGAVHDREGKGVRSRLILYSQGTVTLNTKESVRTVNTDSLGNFVFEKVADGSYLLQAVPFRDYMPAYYSTKSCGELDWKKADLVVVRGGNVGGLVVCVQKAGVRGAGSIFGRVSVGSGTALDGVVITAVSQTDPSVATYAITDAGGNYELTELDAGSFLVTADKVGYVGSNSSIGSVDYLQSSSPLNFQLSIVSVTPVDPTERTVPLQFGLSQNYPNPFNPATNMEFQVPSSQFVELKVYDVLGREVATLVNGQLSPGAYRVRWDAKEQPSGVYFYRLSAGSFVETRKMVLMR